MLLLYDHVVISNKNANINVGQCFFSGHFLGFIPGQLQTPHVISKLLD
jgi:hypothetical protein